MIMKMSFIVHVLTSFLNAVKSLTSSAAFCLFHFFFTLPLVYVTWRHNLNRASSGSLNPFKITSFPPPKKYIYISVCNITVSQLEFPTNISVCKYQCVAVGV